MKLYINLQQSNPSTIHFLLVRIRKLYNFVIYKGDWSYWLWKTPRSSSALLFLDILNAYNIYLVVSSMLVRIVGNSLSGTGGARSLLSLSS